MKLYRLYLCLYFIPFNSNAQPQFNNWQRFNMPAFGYFVQNSQNYTFQADSTTLFYGFGSAPTAFQSFQQPSLNINLHVVTGAIENDLPQTVWITGLTPPSNNGTLNGGFILLLEKDINGNLQYRRNSTKHHVPIWAMAKDKWDTIFLMTQQGVKTYNPSTQIFSSTSSIFLPNAPVYSASVTHGGDVIVASEKGLFLQETSDATRWQSAGFSNENMIYVFCDNQSEVWYATKALNLPFNGKYNTPTQLYRSNTKGQTWNATNLTQVHLREIIKYPQKQTLLAATNKGIYISDDNGLSWKASEFNLDTYDIYLNPSTNFSLYAYTNVGVYQTDFIPTPVSLAEESLSFKKAQVFPNPNPTHFALENASNGTLIIFSVLGQKVWESKVNTNLVEMPFLGTGVYFYQYRQDNLLYQNRFSVIR
jgi:hypothetical protein